MDRCGGGWGGPPKYTWLRCNGDGAACHVVVTGRGNALPYAVTAADAGFRMRVLVEGMTEASGGLSWIGAASVATPVVTSG